MENRLSRAKLVVAMEQQDDAYNQKPPVAFGSIYNDEVIHLRCLVAVELSELVTVCHTC
jgi:hypothetical protein